MGRAVKRQFSVLKATNQKCQTVISALLYFEHRAPTLRLVGGCCKESAYLRLRTANTTLSKQALPPPTATLLTSHLQMKKKAIVS